jgi:hypothetical protein
MQVSVEPNIKTFDAPDDDGLTIETCSGYGGINKRRICESCA